MRLLLRHLPHPRFHFRPVHALFCACVAVTLLAGCFGGDNRAIAMQQVMRDSARYTSIQWLDSTKDFGTIPEGRKVEVAFRFRNTGGTPLVITQVRPSCGCTIADQPLEPVAPGAEGHISATFNSEGHPGINRKTLFVTANTKGNQNYSLHFTVVVDKKTS
ncbi:MAG TPA: DUF1573 domain-containing protein [Puia sp.]|jgi:hypothetical protein|nr:DUF1573 domain-containing protein [Puia sp.]